MNKPTGGYLPYVDGSYAQIVAISPCLDPRVLPDMVDRLNADPIVDKISSNHLDSALIQRITDKTLVINSYRSFKDVSSYIATQRKGPPMLLYYGEIPEFGLTLNMVPNRNITHLFIPLTGGLEFATRLVGVGIDGDSFYSRGAERIAEIQTWRAAHPYVELLAFFRDAEQAEYISNKYNINTELYCSIS